MFRFDKIMIVNRCSGFWQFSVDWMVLVYSLYFVWKVLGFKWKIVISNKVIWQCFSEFDLDSMNLSFV